MPERVRDWQSKLQHWAGLIASGRADVFKEAALLPDFHTDIFCGRLGSIEPARTLAAETLNLEVALNPVQPLSVPVEQLALDVLARREAADGGDHPRAAALRALAVQVVAVAAEH